jgi:hypothetical protein
MGNVNEMYNNNVMCTIYSRTKATQNQVEFA